MVEDKDDGRGEEDGDQADRQTEDPVVTDGDVQVQGGEHGAPHHHVHHLEGQDRFVPFSPLDCSVFMSKTTLLGPVQSQESDYHSLVRGEEIPVVFRETRGGDPELASYLQGRAEQIHMTTAGLSLSNWATSHLTHILATTGPFSLGSYCRFWRKYVHKLKPFSHKRSCALSPFAQQLAPSCETCSCNTGMPEDVIWVGKNKQTSERKAFRERDMIIPASLWNRRERSWAPCISWPTAGPGLSAAEPPSHWLESNEQQCHQITRTTCVLHSAAGLCSRIDLEAAVLQAGTTGRQVEPGVEHRAAGHRQNTLTWETDRQTDKQIRKTCRRIVTQQSS